MSEVRKRIIRKEDSGEEERTTEKYHTELKRLKFL
jgi:hypothetical protein